mmetsp:Transcript_41358/g.74375  ORF Transcript_41358/g.74375 Transcript_41358/m.74375 type:complete len:287 (+) Transcript_41358:555-1415(+)
MTPVSLALFTLLSSRRVLSLFLLHLPICLSNNHLLRLWRFFLHRRPVQAGRQFRGNTVARVSLQRKSLIRCAFIIGVLLLLTFLLVPVRPAQVASPGRTVGDNANLRRLVNLLRCILPCQHLDTMSRIVVTDLQRSLFTYNRNSLRSLYHMQRSIGGGLLRFIILHNCSLLDTLLVLTNGDRGGDFLSHSRGPLLHRLLCFLLPRRYIRARAVQDGLQPIRKRLPTLRRRRRLGLGLLLRALKARERRAVVARIICRIRFTRRPRNLRHRELHRLRCRRRLRGLVV